MSLMWITPTLALLFAAPALVRASGTGACCFPDGSCQILGQNDCTGRGGLYQGDGTACDPNHPCAQLPTGACCLGRDCRVFSEPACANNGGTYLGDGSVCLPNPCEDRGACCFPDASCMQFEERDCIGRDGIFQGVGVSCVPNPCTPQPTGACCFGDDCRIFIQPDCAALGGVYLGDGSTCGPTRCMCRTQVRGDSNCDGVVDFRDIDCFVAALVSESAWARCSDTSHCNFLCANDINQDGVVNFDDIDPFVTLLAGG